MISHLRSPTSVYCFLPLKIKTESGDGEEIAVVEEAEEEDEVMVAYRCRHCIIRFDFIMASLRELKKVQNRKLIAKQQQKRATSRLQV